MFTFKTVECLASRGTAHMMQIGETCHENLTEENLGLNELLQSGAVMITNSPGKNPQLIMLKEITDARIDVIDMAGRLIKSRYLKNEKTVALNEKLATGIYSLRLTARNLSGMLRFAVTD